ncbi:hypothetical protein [Raoultella ornithinolytica]|nr:hypothetical protein [Raoultella ornithinolytica]MCF6630967.1 hypothetical protein [Raoultella ornithinolytica]MCF6644943.1 hypothetical protein [Raoultella ornithinolytica]MCF6648694.1 hypothetical protein [Raoultella ornithinolytica]MCF6663721.1 hypothetical protein [Raoultella ornithinolytica]MCF6679361.1 hypothetical protein [Raoultella ornithinolytica]
MHGFRRVAPDPTDKALFPADLRRRRSRQARASVAPPGTLPWLAHCQ